MPEQSSKSILLIDEDAETLEKLQTTLRREGFQVLVAADGQAGLRLAREGQPDLIILDLLLAGIDGIQVCLQLRQNESTRHIPILLHTALAIPSRGPKGEFALAPDQPIISVDAYMPKPTDLRRMVELVWAMVEPDHPYSDQAGEIVLIVDHDSNQRANIARALSQYGYHVFTARDVNSALRVTQDAQPDLIVINSNLSGSRTIMSHARRTYYDPAIITIMDQDTEISTPLLEDVDDYLPQQVKPWQALLTVKSALEKLRARRLNRELTNQLRQANHRLLETKQALQGQNQELQVTNERLRVLHNAKQTFSNMVVHDLRTPLSAIMGALTLLQMDHTLHLSQRQQETISGALAAGRQLVRLTDTLLDLQRLEAGQMPLTLEPLDPNNLIETSLEQFRPMLEVQEVHAHTDLEDNLPPLLVDWEIAQRVIENLLDNAIKFTPPGGEITLRSRLDAGNVILSVQDTGPGIPKDQQQVMAERFGQMPLDSVVLRPGFDLGLAFCKLATDALQGRIWVESEIGHGSTFYVALPTDENQANTEMTTPGS
ncbi:MAG: response regulator [Anaerolineales bacterium]|nr:MAG: response regulator [Anaerolineales bacterium]